MIQTAPDVVTGKTGARIYGELRWRLNGVQSEKIRQYLADNFDCERLTDTAEHPC